jgi:hypothetical protein
MCTADGENCVELTPSAGVLCVSTRRFWVAMAGSPVVPGPMPISAEVLPCVALEGIPPSPVRRAVVAEFDACSRAYGEGRFARGHGSGTKTHGSDRTGVRGISSGWARREWAGAG